MKPLPYPDKVEGWFARGNAHEVECLAAMRADGWTIEHEQGEVRIGELAGHLDAIGITPYNGGHRVIEVKAPSAWSRFEKAYKTDTWTDPLMVKYAWQVSAYMVATGLECVVITYDGHLRWFVIEKPLHTRDEIEGRVAYITELAKIGLPTACEPGTVEWTCPYRYLHDPEIVNTVDDPELGALIYEYRHRKTVAAAEEKRTKELRVHIEAALPGAGKYDVAGERVTVYATTRTSLDKDAMMAAGIDLAPYEKKTVTTTLRLGNDVG